MVLWDFAIMRSQLCHELIILTSCSKEMIAYQSLLFGALPRNVLLCCCLLFAWVWLYHSLHPCLALCSFATHVYSLGFALWSFAHQLLVDQLIIGFLAFTFTLDLTFTFSSFWIFYLVLQALPLICMTLRMTMMSEPRRCL